MPINDFFYVLHWWILLFGIGILFLPIASLLFTPFFDKGYIFSKIIGIIVISYLALVLGLLHIAPFSNISIFLIVLMVSIINIFFISKKVSLISSIKKHWRIWILEELLFFSGVFFWSYIRGTQPDIHGLEKYMDFGFVNSILRSTYFPPLDMWYPPYAINYYYFGHFVTATLTKLSQIPSSITFNLMLATLFSFTFVASFSLGSNLLYIAFQGKKLHRKILTIVGGILAGAITTFGGNLHTLYTFFKPYENENPVPLWQLPFSPLTFPNNYWYPNATRFIYHTIHEFPLYSFVVSDLHGHVLDIPFVLITIAVLFIYLLRFESLSKTYQLSFNLFVGFLLAIMYMTNAWDGIIYFLLAAGVTEYVLWKKFQQFDIHFITQSVTYVGITAIGFLFFSLPFSLFFKPFASGIGILCAGDLFPTITHIGPFLFEPQHCQHSPFWQLATLYGFFYFFVISFGVFVWKKAKAYLTASDIFVLLLILLSTLLIIIPEFIYLKDIYPAHYRANTMFKLVYQSFIMLSISSAYIIVRILTSLHNKKIKIVYTTMTIFLLLLIGIYPYFAISSYYNNLQTYSGLNGTAYLYTLYPQDYAAIVWINKNITGQPVILEAQGDSYTDYARVSTNTGLPTPLGWTVHEWLWRGSYDPLPERITDIQTLYETTDLSVAKALIQKYNISYIFIGDLEREKYKNLAEEKFAQLGKLVYQNGTTEIYKIK